MDGDKCLDGDRCLDGVIFEVAGAGVSTASVFFTTRAFVTAERLLIKDFFCTAMESSICGPFGPNLTFRGGQFLSVSVGLVLGYCKLRAKLALLTVPRAPYSFSATCNR